MARFWRHLSTLWPGLGILTPLPFVVHGAWMAASGTFHWENALVLGLVLGLFAVGPRTKKLLLGAYPVGLVGVLYTSMKSFQNFNVTEQTVHLCDLRAHEVALFGVRMNGVRVPVHDWLQAHATPVLDALCAIPYGTFMFVCFSCATWLYFRDYSRMRRFAWCFFALNVAGFVTYHVYPAAPPWYFHAHGCHVDLFAHASEGPNLARVDAWMGVPYFAGMYGRASDVFGAVPSLHVAYALIVLLEGWSLFSAPWRVASAAFFALMVFAAAYLDHHWVIDEVLGIVYCVLVVLAARRLTRAPGDKAKVEAGNAVLRDPSATGGAS
jgi:hypothetical protein